MNLLFFATTVDVYGQNKKPGGESSWHERDSSRLHEGLLTLKVPEYFNRLLKSFIFIKSVLKVFGRKLSVCYVLMTDLFYVWAYCHSKSISFNPPMAEGRMTPPSELS